MPRGQFNAETVEREIVSTTRSSLEESQSSQPDALAPIIDVLVDGMRWNGVAAEGDQLGTLLHEEFQRTFTWLQPMFESSNVC